MRRLRSYYPLFFGLSYLKVIFCNILIILQIMRNYYYNPSNHCVWFAAEKVDYNLKLCQGQALEDISYNPDCLSSPFSSTLFPHLKLTTKLIEGLKIAVWSTLTLEPFPTMPGITPDRHGSNQTIFRKAPRLSFPAWCKYLDEIATAKKMDVNTIKNKLVECGAPGITGGTVSLFSFSPTIFAKNADISWKTFLFNL